MRKSNFCLRLWKAFSNSFRYFGDNSNLHGVGKVCSLGYLGIEKRFIWLIIIVGSLFGMCSILLASLALYKNSLVSFSVETDYLDWDTLFPSITICELLDNEKIDIHLEDHQIPFSMTQFYRDINFVNRVYCKSCVGCTPGKNCAENIQEIVRDFRSNCSQVLTECWWNGDKFPCCDRFKEVETEFGVCFAFNSRLARNGSELIYDNRRTGPSTIDFIAKESVSVPIKIHSADESIIFGGDNVLGPDSQLPFVTDLMVQLKLEETVSEASVRALPAEARGCHYWWEQPAAARADVLRAPRYSYTACRLQCKAAAQLARCNCTHHLMPRTGAPACDLSGLVCLTVTKDDQTAVVDCNCLPACEETLYQVVYVYHKQHNDRLTKELLERGTRGSVRLARLPTLRVRRQVIRDMLGLVVDIGGVGGVFFGASILSVIEIVYLFCMRSRN